MAASRDLIAIDRTDELRFYDRLRAATLRWAGQQAGTLGHGVASTLLFAPDVFMLLCRLIRRPEVARHDRALLTLALAYFLLPVDLVPDWLLGPLGFADDLMLATAALRAALVRTPGQVIADEWSGSSGLIEVLSGVARLADWLTRYPVFRRVRRLIEYLFT